MGLQSVCQVGNRCVAFGTLLSLACLHLIFSCKQNDSSEVLSSSEWSYEALLYACVPPACIWCALGFLCLKGTCFFWKHILVKWPNLWQLTLVFLHWTLEPLYSTWITTLGTSCLVIMHPSCVKFLLGLCLQMVPLLALILVIDCLGSYLTFSFCISQQKLCSLVSERLMLSSLWVTYYLLNMACCGLGTFYFLASCLTLLAGNFSKSTLPSLMVLGGKLFIMQEKPEDVPLQDLGCLRGVFS